MRTGGEQLGDDGSLEAFLDETEGSAETGTTGADDDGVILMVDNCSKGNNKLNEAVQEFDCESKPWTLISKTKENIKDTNLGSA